jgi:hypothetical protein
LLSFQAEPTPARGDRGLLEKALREVHAPVEEQGGFRRRRLDHEEVRAGMIGAPVMPPPPRISAVLVSTRKA